MKTIRVDINKDGKVTLETSGFIGGTCKDAVKVFKDALGVSTSETEKPEMYMTEEQSNVITL